MMNNNQLALVRKQIFNGPDDIMRVVSQKSEIISEKVNSLEKVYHTIDVRQTMQNLMQVTQLLNLSFAASKGFSSNTKVSIILCDYQQLIKNSKAASTAFIGGCIQAVKFHTKAFECVEKSKYDAALKIIRMCANVAQKMAEDSEKLVKESDKLCEESRAALIAATEDETVSIEKRKEIQAQIDESKVIEGKLTSLTTDLASQVAEEQAREKEIRKKADQAQRQAFAVSILKACMKPFTDIAGVFTGLFLSGKESSTTFEKTLENLTKDVNNKKEQLANTEKNLEIAQQTLNLEKNKEIPDLNKIQQLEEDIIKLVAESKSKRTLVDSCVTALSEVQKTCESSAANYQQQEEKIAAKRAELQKAHREANADLKASVIKLQQLNVGEGNLDKTITSLEIAVKTLGKVKTTFENTRLFWKGVENHCKSLADVGLFEIHAETADADMFCNELQDSAWSWVVLGKLNIEASNLLKDVDDKNDEKMSNLPTSAEAMALIDNVTKNILHQLKTEDTPKIEEKKD